MRRRRPAPAATPPTPRRASASAAPRPRPGARWPCAGLRPGAPRGRKVVDLHVRQVERDRDVAQPAVDADRRLHAAPGGRSTAPRSSAGQTSAAARRCARGDALGARLLGGAGVRQRDAPAVVDAARRPSVDPVRLGPQLVVARGAVDEGDVGVASAAAARRARAGRSAAARRARSRARAPRARASGRAHGCAARPGSRGRPASAPAIRGSTPSVRLREAVARRRAPSARDQRRLGQALQVEHRVVALAAQAPRRTRDISARTSPRPPAPGASAAAGTRSTLVDAVARGAPAARSRARPPSRSRACGCAATMSCTTGIAWTTSPSDDSLTIRMRTAPRAVRARRSVRRAPRQLRVGLDARAAPP